jgi:hypothetical protein
VQIVQIADDHGDDDPDAPAAGKTILEYVPVRSPRDFVVFTPKMTFQKPARARCVQDEASSRFSLLLSMNFSGKSAFPSGRGPMGVIFRIMP